MKEAVLEIRAVGRRCADVTVEFAGATEGLVSVDGAEPHECITERLCKFRVLDGSRTVKTVHKVVDDAAQVTTDRFFRCQVCEAKEQLEREQEQVSTERGQVDAAADETEWDSGSSRNSTAGASPYLGTGPYARPSPYGKNGRQTVKSIGASSPTDYLEQNQSVVEASENTPAFGSEVSGSAALVPMDGTLSNQQCAQLMEQVRAYDEVLPAYEARANDPAVRRVYLEVVSARNQNADLFNSKCR